ncbi:MAG: M48 family metallopeptidase [Staphylococcus sp.]|nr:M48 family metallopeptidase [Staphylococcus sp.]
MKKNLLKAFAIALALAAAVPASAQFKLGKAISAGTKAVKAATLTDAQMAAYVKESVDWMDTHNPVTPDDNPYTIRLKKLTEGLNDVNGIPLNFKVYDVIDVNAFACADGSVRVFSSLMDIMDDDQLLGVIGHEIGHVAKHHSKNAFKTALLTDALKDGIASTGGTAAALTESQLGALGESIINAKYSQKQETEADDYGYDFLKQHGKNPWGMASAFEKLQEMEGGEAAKASYISKMFSSHPETAARIKHISERCKKDGIERPETPAKAE